MIKKLTKHGNSQALIIDKALLDILNITDDTELELTTDGTTLHITPIQKGIKKISDDKKLQAIIEKNITKYAPLLKKLADN